MPRSSLRFCAFISQNDLIAGRTARLENLRMMTTAKQLAVLMKVNQIDQKLRTDAALETARMPAHRWDPRREHAHWLRLNRIFTLEKIDFREINWKLEEIDFTQQRRRDSNSNFSHLIARHLFLYLFHKAAAECISLSLCTEQFQFGGFFVGERVTIADLIVLRWQLLEELFDAIALTDAVDVGHFVLRKWGEVKQNLRAIWERFFWFLGKFL